jgi:hypothetical protein
MARPGIGDPWFFLCSTLAALGQTAWPEAQVDAPQNHHGEPQETLFAAS